MNDDDYLQKRLIGSQTAKNGFSNEADIVVKFNNWKIDIDAQAWLEEMGYKISDISKVVAEKVTGSYKADIQVRVSIYLKTLIDAQNVSIKLVSNPTGFNQIDKRWVSKYVELWKIPSDIEVILKKFTGEIQPRGVTRDGRRTFFDEMPIEDQNKVVSFFDTNKTLVLADILKGRDPFSAAWFLVVLKTNGKILWKLADINTVLNFYAQGEVVVTDRGSLKIGGVTMQRKGGDGGRSTANMLQFKINPVGVFKI